MNDDYIDQEQQDKLNIKIYILPNLLTTFNLFCGFFSILKTMEQNYVAAAYFIIAAAVFDLLDGRVARMTNATSAFGAEYDSLNDLISFGLAPSLLMYYMTLKDLGRIGWVAAFLYLACGALRLARFNVQKQISDTTYFQGLPIPMAAGIISSAVLAFHELNFTTKNSFLLLFMMLLLAFVMVSDFNYRSFKDVDLKKRLPFTFLVGGVLICTIIALNPGIMFFVLFMTYATLGAVIGFFKKGKKITAKLSASKSVTK